MKPLIKSQKAEGTGTAKSSAEILKSNVIPDSKNGDPLKSSTKGALTICEPEPEKW